MQQQQQTHISSNNHDRKAKTWTQRCWPERVRCCEAKVATGTIHRTSILFHMVLSCSSLMQSLNNPTVPFAITMCSSMLGLSIRWKIRRCMHQSLWVILNTTSELKVEIRASGCTWSCTFFFSRCISPTYHPLTSFLQLNYFRPHNIPNSNETKPEIPHQHLAIPT
jgi:low temperature requirement protein LtrA